MSLINEVYNTGQFIHAFAPVQHPSSSSAFDPVDAIPKELIQYLFSGLNLADLSTSCLVSKRWEQLANSPIVWQNVIYKEIAFSNEKWAQHFGMHAVKDEDSQEEFSSLPLNIVEEYRKFQCAFPKKKAKASLMLVRLPKTLNGQLTLKKLGELIKPFFSPLNTTGYSNSDKSTPERVLGKLGDKSIDKSRWVLMTEILPESRGITETKQEAIVANLANKKLIGYEVPEILEATTCILAQYFNSKQTSTSFGFEDEVVAAYPFNGGNPRMQGKVMSSIHCRETGISAWEHIFVGGLGLGGPNDPHSGLRLYSVEMVSRSIGIAALKKL